MSIALLAASTVLVAACGGASPVAQPEQPSATSVASETPEETPSEPTTSLAFVEPDVTLAGTTEAQVYPGETVTLDHLVYNSTSGTRSVRFGASSVDGLDADLSISSVRLSGEEIISFTSTLTIPSDASVGDVLRLRVQAAVPGGEVPAVADVELTVVAASGRRPDVASTSGTTSTNEKIRVYVLGSVVDLDGDLDQGSLRVVWPGFRSDEVTAENGTVTYHPFLNVTGTDMVLFEVCDDDGWCDTGSITIDVQG